MGYVWVGGDEVQTVGVGNPRVRVTCCVFERARGDVDVVAGPRVEIGYQIDSDGGRSRPGDLAAGGRDGLHHGAVVGTVNGHLTGGCVDGFVENEGRT